MKYNKVYNIEHAKPLAVIPDYKIENIYSMANEYKDKQFAIEQEYKASLIKKLISLGFTGNIKRLERKSIAGLEFSISNN
jgi:hypothetical protein